MKGITRQPCHGCGTTSPHAAGSLCPVCRQKLEDLDRIKTDGAAYLATLGSVDLPTRPYDLPYLPGDDEPHYPLRTAVMRLLHQIASRPDVPTPRYNNLRFIPRHLRDGYRPGAAQGIMSEGVAEAFAELYGQIAEAMKRARAEGFTDGSHFLRRLAAGDVSESDFERRRQG